MITKEVVITVTGEDEETVDRVLGYYAADILDSGAGERTISFWGIPKIVRTTAKQIKFYKEMLED